MERARQGGWWGGSEGEGRGGERVRKMEVHFTDYGANLRDPFHALVPRTKSSNNSGITALPK